MEGINFNSRNEFDIFGACIWRHVAVKLDYSECTIAHLSGTRRPSTHFSIPHHIDTPIIFPTCQPLLYKLHIYTYSYYMNKGSVVSIMLQTCFSHLDFVISRQQHIVKLKWLTACVTLL